MKNLKTMYLLLMAGVMAFSACGKDEDKEPENKLPIANAGSDQTVVVGDQVKLTAAASSDPEGKTLYYKWKAAANNPTQVSLSDANAEKPEFTAPSQKGEYSFSLIVSDGEKSSTPDEVKITVEEKQDSNSKPVANAGQDQTVKAGDEVGLDASASTDADQDQLTYSWTAVSSNPETVSLSSTTDAKPKFTAPQTAGEYEFELTVNDGKVNSDVDKVIITVEKSTQTSSVVYTNVPRSGVLLKSIAFGNNTFVAVGHYGNSANDEDRGSINYSTDGENWTEVADMTGGDSWHEVIYANNRFIATGDFGAIATSTDGISWIKTKTTEQWDWLSVTYRSGVYVFTSKSARFAVAKKDNFSDIRIMKSNYTDDVWYSITHSDNEFVMVGNNGRAGYSADGENWTFKTIDKQNYSHFVSVTKGSDGYVACISQGSLRTAHSSDGENWTIRSNGMSLQAARFLNKEYVLLGTYLKNEKIYFSSSLDLSSVDEFEAEGDWLDVSYGKGKYVVVGNKLAIIER